MEINNNFMSQSISAITKAVFDTVIHNAMVITGDGKTSFYGMVGINGDKISYAGKPIEFSSGNVIDARGMVLSPGFIDIHTHSDFSILLYPDAESKISQGVTTEVVGNCGLSSAPLEGQAWQRWNNRWKNKNLTVDWHTHLEYFDRLNSSKIALNIAPLVGHGNIRSYFKDYSSAPFSSDELKNVKALLDDCLKSGYWGVSLGLAYPPGIFADDREVNCLFESAGKNGGIVTVHMRDEGEYLEENIDSMLSLAQKNNVSLQISHLKTCGRNNWGKIDSVINKIDDAVCNKNINAHFDRYPYTALNTDLDWIIPQEIFDGGIENAVNNLKNRIVRKNIEDGLKRQYSKDDAENIIISSIRQDKSIFLGKKLTDILGGFNDSFWEKFIAFVIDINFDAEASFIFMNEGNMKTILSHPRCIAASDSSIRPFSDASNPHPRTYGTFPKFLKLVIDEKMMTIQQAIYKITGLPSKKLGLKNRGLITENYCADLVLFNIDEIDSLSNYDNPKLKPKGIASVWVNGKCVFNGSGFCGNYPGKLILRG